MPGLPAAKTLSFPPDNPKPGMCLLCGSKVRPPSHSSPSLAGPVLPGRVFWSEYTASSSPHTLRGSDPRPRVSTIPDTETQPRLPPELTPYLASLPIAPVLGAAPSPLNLPGGAVTHSPGVALMPCQRQCWGPAPGRHCPPTAPARSPPGPATHRSLGSATSRSPRPVAGRSRQEPPSAAGAGAGTDPQPDQARGDHLMGVEEPPGGPGAEPLDG